MRDVADFMSQDDAISIVSSALREKVADLSKSIVKGAAQTSLKLNQQLLIAGGSAPTEKYVPVNGNKHEARCLSSAATFGGETTYTGRK